MSLASPSIPPMASPDGEGAGGALRGPRRRHASRGASVRPPRSTRPTAARLASVHPAPKLASVPASLPAEREAPLPGAKPANAVPNIGALTLIYLDPRTLRPKTIELRSSAARVALLACLFLFAASASLGAMAGSAFGLADSGRVLSMQQSLGVPALHSFFAGLPGLEGLHALRRPTPAREPAEVARERAARLGLGTTAAASALISGVARPEWVSEAAAAGPARGTLRWPVDDGWFVRGYGSGTAGYHLAVDVGGPVGRRVYAAASGIVAYADDEIRGFGNLLLLVHANGLITLYAHNSRHHVAVGERVEAGQLVAEVGSTGISRGPHVHFELLHRGKNCDPAPLFRPAILHRDGEPSEVTKADWDGSGERPGEIRCERRRIHPNSARLRDHGGELDAHDHEGPELALEAPSAG